MTHKGLHNNIAIAMYLAICLYNIGIKRTEFIINTITLYVYIANWWYVLFLLKHSFAQCYL